MTVPDQLPDDIDALKAIIRTQQDQNARLEALVKGKRFSGGLTQMTGTS